ncbi:MAG: hypothetical protein FVQ82_10950 [Planctomycetes bacterium]|nr:hypothetical protein [Planctomycetota bacterium]
MKKIAILVIVFSGLVMASAVTAAEVASRQELWKQVDAAMKKGLPKTAIKHLEPIIEGALAEKKYAEAVKALAKRIAYEGQVQGRKAEENIVRLEAVIGEWPKEANPVLETVLAHWYWNFFQQNRWRFLLRTQTAEAPGDDILSWSLPRIFTEIDKHFIAALASGDILKKTPIADFDDLLRKGNVPDSFRPTLYDFIAHEALRFYSSGEQAAAAAQDAFDFSADTPALGSVEEFLGWKIETTDDASTKLKAINLLKELITFHKNDDDPSALIDADLARLVYAYNKAYGESKDKRYNAALEKFIDQWADHRISARARAKLARQIQKDGDLVKARQIAKQGEQAFPKTPGGIECYHIVRNIESKSASINVERVWNSPAPEIQLQYKNIDKVYFRMVEYDWMKIVEGRWKTSLRSNNEVRKLLELDPVSEWSSDLPKTDDYKTRSEKFATPKDLKPGFYVIFASHDKDFKKNKNNITNYTTCWVSKLALVIRYIHANGKINGFVLNAITGEPVADAVVKAWTRDKKGNAAAINPVETNRDGLFSFSLKGDRYQGHILLASSGGHQISTNNAINNYFREQKDKPFLATYFFTDRSIYRPGQTINYKGLAIRADQKNADYTAVAGASVEVIFRDRNGKEIERRKHTANDYGSFNGSFTAPRDRVMGRMSLRGYGNGSGNASVTVEEYKRPKFKVALAAPKKGAKLDDTVKLTGTATSYTGAAIDGAKVTYRVVRQVQYPMWWHWCYWWMPPNRGSSQEIAHGSVKTATDGTFDISFTATPDRTVLEKDEPTFRYTIYADVTDSSGETRSDQKAVNVGYTALKANMSAANWQEKGKAVELTISTQTLDGLAQSAKGKVKIYKLKEPKKVHRVKLSGYPRPYYGRGRIGSAGGVKPEPDLSNPNSWELGDIAVEKKFTTSDEGTKLLKLKLGAGLYRAMLETKDRFGKKVTARLPIQVLDTSTKHLTLKIPNLVAAPKWSLEPGESFNALWGTGYDKGRAYIEIVHRNKPLLAYWTDQGRTQAIVEQSVTERLRGGFTLRVTQVRENRAYVTQRKVNVPWSNKKLNIKWAHHTSKLEPGQKETWTAKVTGPNAKGAVAEIAATLYDESLDAYLPHRWMSAFGMFYQDYSNMNSTLQNRVNGFRHLHGNWPRHYQSHYLLYRSFPSDIISNRNRIIKYSRAHRSLGGIAKNDGLEMESAAMDATVPAPRASRFFAKKTPSSSEMTYPAEETTTKPSPNLDQVTARKNLQETAFFFPNLITNKDGSVDLEFTMPEALTKWKFMAFAHDKELRAGFLTDSVVTQKDIMVQPNAPRFMREGDVLEFSVKVINLSPTRQRGTVRLTLSNARTLKSNDKALGNTKTDLKFDIPAKESRSYSWKLNVADGQGFLIYKAVAATSKLSDGEEGYLPVLPRRIMVTESLPLPIRGAMTKKFDFTKLINSGKSDSLSHESLTVQMVSNPSWYAVMALPYLMEHPSKCSEAIFNRLYANTLASHIAGSDPKIRRIFDLWKGTAALDSPMEKNEDIKAIMLEETPWLRQGEKESQARRNVGILFDKNRLETELAKAQRQLAQQQLSDGAWPWYPGGRANDYITLYITTGYGRLRHLGAKGVDMKPAIKSLNRLDRWIDKRYKEILKHGNKDKNHLTSRVALYLYCRSFFLEDRAVGKGHKEAVDYFLGQAAKYWLRLGPRQSKAHIALALQRFGVYKKTPMDIMNSIKEHSVSNEEMGMFWRDTEFSYWWYRAPIETQAMMIEAFDEVAKDSGAVEDCKVWLLKQKQTRDWKTTKGTADAVYALLLRGADLLASDELVQVTIGDMKIEPKNVEAGTGFYEQKLLRKEVEPQHGKVTVTKVDEGVAWGSVHWQYFETIEKITPHEGTPLTLKKALYTKTNTKKGPVLTRVKAGDKLKVGDELVARIELRSDRDMEYLHLKDQRGSGTEPVNVLSRYRYQDGLGYYESTRDTASHFFIDYLPKGTYVFEYSVRVQHRGAYHSGMANIQCLYAPEFNSHSESFILTVK